MFLYLLNISLPFILFILPCLGWPLCMLKVCGSSLLWRLLPMGGVGRMACQGFLVREACVGVLGEGVELAQGLLVPVRILC